MKLNVAALFLLVSSSALANPYGYYGPQAGYYPGGTGYYGYAKPAPRVQVSEPAPDQIVSEGIQLLKGFVAKGEGSDSQTLAFLDAKIAPYFDFDYMAQWSAGPRFNTLSDAQKTAFATRIKSLFFAALARNLSGYGGASPRVDVFPPRGKQSGEVTVSARVTPPSGYPLRLDFRFYRSDAGWRIFDVTANGTSATTYYRKAFNRMVSSGAL